MGAFDHLLDMPVPSARKPKTSGSQFSGLLDMPVPSAPAASGTAQPASQFAGLLDAPVPGAAPAEEKPRGFLKEVGSLFKGHAAGLDSYGHGIANLASGGFIGKAREDALAGAKTRLAGGHDSYRDVVRQAMAVKPKRTMWTKSYEEQGLGTAPQEADLSLGSDSVMADLAGGGMASTLFGNMSEDEIVKKLHEADKKYTTDFITNREKGEGDRTKRGHIGAGFGGLIQGGAEFMPHGISRKLMYDAPTDAKIGAAPRMQLQDGELVLTKEGRDTTEWDTAKASGRNVVEAVSEVALGPIMKGVGGALARTGIGGAVVKPVKAVTGAIADSKIVTAIKNTAVAKFGRRVRNTKAYQTGGKLTAIGSTKEETFEELFQGVINDPVWNVDGEEGPLIDRVSRQGVDFAVNAPYLVAGLMLGNALRVGAFAPFARADRKKRASFDAEALEESLRFIDAESAKATEANTKKTADFLERLYQIDDPELALEAVDKFLGTRGFKVTEGGPVIDAFRKQFTLEFGKNGARGSLKTGVKDAIAAKVKQAAAEDEAAFRSVSGNMLAGSTPGQASNEALSRTIASARIPNDEQLARIEEVRGTDPMWRLYEQSSPDNLPAALRVYEADRAEEAAEQAEEDAYNADMTARQESYPAAAPVQAPPSTPAEAIDHEVAALLNASTAQREVDEQNAQGQPAGEAQPQASQPQQDGAASQAALPLEEVSGAAAEAPVAATAPQYAPGMPDYDAMDDAQLNEQATAGGISSEGGREGVIASLKKGWETPAESSIDTATPTGAQSPHADAADRQTVDPASNPPASEQGGQGTRAADPSQQPDAASGSPSQTVVVSKRTYELRGDTWYTQSGRVVTGKKILPRLEKALPKNAPVTEAGGTEQELRDAFGYHSITDDVLEGMIGELEQASKNAHMAGKQPVVADGRSAMGEVIDFHNAGKVYPEGMDKNNITALRKFIKRDGKLTTGQLDRMQTVLDYMLDRDGLDVEVNEIRGEMDAAISRGERPQAPDTEAYPAVYKRALAHAGVTEDTLSAPSDPYAMPGDALAARAEALEWADAALEASYAPKGDTSFDFGFNVKPAEKATPVKSLDSLLEGTESTREKVRGETEKPQVAQDDLLGELKTSKQAGERERAQGKMDLGGEKATPAKKAAKEEPDGYALGFPYKLTGETEEIGGKTWDHGVYLDGPKKGEALVVPTAEAQAENDQQRKDEAQNAKDGFKRVAELEKEKAAPKADATDSNELPEQARDGYIIPIDPKHLVEGFMVPDFAYTALGDVKTEPGQTVVKTTFYQRKGLKRRSEGLSSDHPLFRVSVIRYADGALGSRAERAIGQNGNSAGQFVRFEDIGDDIENAGYAPLGKFARKLWQSVKDDEGQGGLFDEPTPARSNTEVAKEAQKRVDGPVFNASDMDQEKIRNAYQHMHTGVSALARSIAESYETDMRAFQATLEDEVAEDRRADLRTALENYRDEYVTRYDSVLNAASTTASTMITGRSGLKKSTRKQMTQRGNAYDRAGEAFNAWNKGAQGMVLSKSGITAARQAATKEAATQKEGKRQRGMLKTAKDIIAMKNGDVKKAFTVERVNKGRDGYPTSLTISGKDIIKGHNDRIDLARDLFGGSKDDLRKYIDMARAEAAEETQAPAATEAKPAASPRGNALREISLDSYKSWEQAKTAGARNGWKIKHDEMFNAFVAIRKGKRPNEAGGGPVWAELKHGFTTKEEALDWAADHGQTVPEWAKEQASSPAAPAKREAIDWFVNYTETDGTGRTTETKRFGKLSEAKAFANGKHGYITRSTDGGKRLDAEAGKTEFVEYFGGFVPSAQAEAEISSLTGQPAPAPAKHPKGAAIKAKVKAKKETKAAPNSTIDGSKGFKVLEVVDTRAWVDQGDDKWKAVRGSGKPRPCDRCGRDHEIHFYATDLANGKKVCIGGSCVTEVGVVDKSMHTKAISAAKAIARYTAELERIEEMLIDYDAANDEVDTLTPPEIVETYGKIGAAKGRMGWRMGPESNVTWTRDGAVSPRERAALNKGWRAHEIARILGAADYSDAVSRGALALRKEKAQEKLSKAAARLGVITAIEDAAAGDKPIFSVNWFQKLRTQARDGSISLADFQSAADMVLKDEALAKEILNGMSKPDLQKAFNFAGWGRRMSDYKKADAVSKSYENILEWFQMGKAPMSRTYSIMSMMDKDAMRAQKEQERAELIERIHSVTEADLKEYSEAATEAQADRKKAVEKHNATMENPQTLEDFDTLIRSRGFHSMTAEQVEAWDKLKADKALENAKADRADRAKVDQIDNEVAASVPMEYEEGEHSRTGAAIHIVSLGDRVGKEAFRELAGKAKRLGGRWGYNSRYGNSPDGFNFKTKDAAEEFIGLQSGSVDRSDKAEADHRSREERSAERLIEMADKQETDGTESLNADRQTNTHKRAGQAASAVASAESKVQFAKILRNVAEAVRSGDAKYLAGIRAATHLEAIQREVNRAKEKWHGLNKLDEKSMTYREIEIARSERKHRAPTLEDVRVMTYPHETIKDETAERLIMALRGVRGQKMFADRMTKLLKKHGHIELSLSGLQRIKNAMGKDSPWYIDDEMAHIKRLEAMGITESYQLRMAAREYLRYYEAGPKADPIKAKLAEVQNKPYAGFDFFPTPDATAKGMAEWLDIEPGMKVLEPSAGVGHLADAAKTAQPDAVIHTVEPLGDLREILEHKGHELVGRDFDDMKPRTAFTYGDLFKAPNGTVGTMSGGSMGSNRVTLLGEDGESLGYFNADELKGIEHRGAVSGYDRIIMNPPFSKNKDIQHVKRAFSMLKPGGKMAAVTSAHWTFASDKESKAFREWLDEVGGESEELGQIFNGKDAFRKTGVNSMMVKIVKPEGDGARYRDASGLWHSPVERAAEALKMKKGGAAQMKAMLLKTPGVRAQEMDESGMGDWLDMKAEAGEKVTRDEIVAFSRANGVQVEEVELGEMPPRAAKEIIGEPVRITRDNVADMEWIEEAGLFEDDDVVAVLVYAQQTTIQEMRDGSYFLEGEGTYNEGDLPAVEIALATWLDQEGYTEEDHTTSKYHDYQIPGGENYRELLLTMPKSQEYNNWESVRKELDAVETEPASGQRWEVSEIQKMGTTVGWAVHPYNDGGYWDKWNKEGRTFDNYTDAVDDLAAKDPRYERVASLMKREKQAEGSMKDYRSSHFDEANILAHIRLNERTTDDGKRMLFIEEIQSDWHQEGRRSGYLAHKSFTSYEQIEVGHFIKWYGEVASIEGEKGNRFYRFVGRGGKLAQAQFDLANASTTDPTGRSGAVPDAPMKGTAWKRMAFRRALKWATDNGFDTIGWTTGEMQNDRYSLAKKVTHINVSPLEDGMKFVMINTIQGPMPLEVNSDGKVTKARNTAAEQSGAVGKPLDEVIGKDVAKRVMDMEKGRLEGDGLKVGGTGMKGFYDRELPNIAKDIIKRMDKKARVTGATLGMPEADTMNGEEVMEGETGPAVHAIHITDQMRERGQGSAPLYREGHATPARHFDEKAATDLISAWLGDSVAAVHIQKVVNLNGVEQAGAMIGRTRDIFLNPRVGNMKDTAAHEAIHFIRDLVQSHADNKALGDAMTKVGWDEEALAEGVITYLQNGKLTNADMQRLAGNHKQAAGAKGLFGKLRSLIRRFVAKVRDLMNRDAVKQIEDFYAAAARGDFAGKSTHNANADHQTRFADNDAAYMAAVESGDTATQQRMVDEAAKAAGFNVGPKYFGGPKGLTKLTRQHPSMRKAMHGQGIWMTSSNADDYSSQQHDGGQVYRLFARINNPARVYDESVADDDITVEKLKAQGYDGAEMAQSGWVVAFDASQVKSADPITRDDEGNVTPLSERFGAGDDIRYRAVQQARKAVTKQAAKIGKSLADKTVMKTEAGRTAAEYLTGPRIKDSNGKTDFTPFEVLLSQPFHYYQKIPATAEVMDAGLEMGDITTEISNRIFGGAEFDSDFSVILRLARPGLTMKKEKRKANREAKATWARVEQYILERDRQQISHTVVFDEDKGGFVIRDSDGRTVSVETSRDETDFAARDRAWQTAFNDEYATLQKDTNFGQAGADAVLAFRRITNRGYQELDASYRKYIDALKEYDIKPGKEAKDLFDQLREMGDRRGYYYPRMREMGRFTMKYTDANGHPQFEKFLTKTVRDLRKAQLKTTQQLPESTFRYKETDQPSEDAHSDLNMMAMNDYLSNSMEQIQKLDDKAFSLKTLGWKGVTEEYTKADGTTEKQLVLTPPEGVNVHKYSLRMRDVLKGAYPDKANNTIRVPNPAPGAQKKAGHVIAQHYYGEVLPAEMAGSMLTKHIAEAIQARGSRSHKIGRTEVDMDTDEAIAAYKEFRKGKRGKMKETEIKREFRREWREKNTTRGYNEEVLNSLAKYAFAIAGGSSKAITAKKMMASITGQVETWPKFRDAHLPGGVEKGTDEYASAMTETWKAYRELIKKNRLDSSKQPHAYKDAISYFKNMMRNEEDTERKIGILRGLAATKYLSGLGSALVNTTALVTTVPAAMKHYGNINPAAGTKEIGKGINLYTRYVMHMKYGKGEAPTGEMRELLDYIVAQGWDEATRNTEAMSALHGSVKSSWRKVLEVGMLAFSTTEKMNRASTIIAAYRLLRKQGKSVEEARELAKKISDKGHGVYGKANLPAWARGSDMGSQALRSAYMFKTFTHNYFLILGEMLKAKDVTSATWAMLSPMIVAGAGAGLTPLVKMFVGAIPGGPEPEEYEEAFYNWAGETFGETGENFARYGVTGLGGYGVSTKSSLSSGLEIPTTMVEFLGAPASFVTDYVEAAGAVTKGEFLRAAELASPRMIAGAFKGIREHKYGVTNRSNQPLFYGDEQMQATVMDAVKRATGFNPVNIARMRDQQWNERTIEMHMGENRSDIYARTRAYFLAAPGDRNGSDWLDIIELVEEYNAMARASHVLGVPMITERSLKAAITKMDKAPKKERLRAAGEAKKAAPSRSSLLGVGLL